MPFSSVLFSFYRCHPHLSYVYLCMVCVSRINVFFYLFRSFFFLIHLNSHRLPSKNDGTLCESLQSALFYLLPLYLPYILQLCGKHQMCVCVSHQMVMTTPRVCPGCLPRPPVKTWRRPLGCPMAAATSAWRPAARRKAVPGCRTPASSVINPSGTSFSVHLGKHRSRDVSRRLFLLNVRADVNEARCVY